MSEEKAKKPEKKSKTGLIAGIIGGLAVVIIAVVLVIVLGGGYKKKTETFTIKNDSRGSEVTFDFAAEELGYKAEDYVNGIKFTNPEDKSTITIRLYDIWERDIIKPADAFYSDKYHDWSEVKFGDYEGFKVFYSAELASKVEMALVLDMYDESTSRVDGVTIMIEQSPMQPRDAEFDPIKFYESEDFKHLVETMKLTVAEPTEE